MTKNSRKNIEKIKKKDSLLSKFLGFFKKSDTKKTAKIKSHNKLWALILVQYKDKVDTSWTYSFKTILQKIVFSLIKFGLIMGSIFGIIKLVTFMFLIYNEITNLFLIFLGFYTVLNLLSVTFALVKSLYFAEDNKVLATFPTTSTKLFFSKILVFELFELKKSFDILLPISLGFLLACVLNGVLPWVVMIWALLPLLAIITTIVLFGALLSIPALYVYKLMKRYVWLELSLIFLIIFAAIAGLVYLTTLIPEGKGTININQSYLAIKMGIHNFAIIFGKILYPINFIYKSIVGETGTAISNELTLFTFLRVVILFAFIGALFVCVLLIIKPFYFNMMTKTFEFDKKQANARKDRVKTKWWSIILKEFKLTFRNFDISGSYLIVYVVAPILLLLIDKTFAAMATNVLGDVMVIAFNIILISIPILASSTVVATVYSREGRTAYFKKTKPLKPYFILTAKLLFNLVFVIPSIIVSCIIFVRYTNADFITGVLTGLIVLILEYGHIFLSASLDIMNPQNEIYATEGSSISNPNERKSIAIALFSSLIVGVLSFLFCFESKIHQSLIKILIICLIVSISCIIFFYLNIKAFYIDRQEASK